MDKIIVVVVKVFQSKPWSPEFLIESTLLEKQVIDMFILLFCNWAR